MKFFLKILLNILILNKVQHVESVPPESVKPPDFELLESFEFESMLDQVFNAALNKNAEIPGNDFIRWKKNKKSILVDVILETGSNDAGAKSNAEKELGPSLASLGFEIERCTKFVCSGFMPIKKYPEFSDLPQVKGIRPALCKTNQAGSIVNEAVQAMRVDKVRQELDSKLTGAGLKIGILSDSFDTSATAVTSATEDIISGDLPSVTVLSEYFRDFFDLFFGNPIDEGRAMAQLIHDVVPDAEIFFWSAFKGEPDFAYGIQALANAGCNVIVDDVCKYFSRLSVHFIIKNYSLSNLPTF